MIGQITPAGAPTNVINSEQQALTLFGPSSTSQTSAQFTVDQHPFTLAAFNLGSDDVITIQQVVYQGGSQLVSTYQPVYGPAVMDTHRSKFIIEQPGRYQLHHTGSSSLGTFTVLGGAYASTSSGIAELAAALQSVIVNNGLVVTGTSPIVVTGTGPYDVTIPTVQVSGATGATASASDTIAIGSGASSTSNSSVAVGATASVTSPVSVAIGKGASVSGPGEEVAIGYLATVSGQNGVAVGQQTSVSASNAVAVGGAAVASGAGAIAIGSQSSSSSDNGTAIGPLASCTGNGVAIGASAGSVTTGGTSVGGSSQATGQYTCAYGHAAIAEANYSIAVGFNTETFSSYTIAIGANAGQGDHTHGDTIVIASAATPTLATQDHQIVLGTSTNTQLVTAGSIIQGGVISASDERLKKNIDNEVNALDTLAKLSPVTFNWNSDAISQFSAVVPTVDLERKQHGLIAQEVEDVLPEFVENIDRGSGSYKLIHYDRFTSMLIAAVNELSAKVKALENKQ